MKIKEVIAQTGLTDRAIRLYIENGLVAPENQKSYTGRNNYHFSQEDIVCLEQIAMLRKADFSLEQIRTLKQGGAAAREVLLAYLSAKQESVLIGQRIVEALKDYSAQDPVTMEHVCAKIKESIENTPLPEGDRKETRGERVEKWLMRIPAILLLVFWGLLGIGVFITYRDAFVFPRFYPNPVNYIGILHVLFPIILAITVLLLYRKQLLHPGKRKKRRWIAGGAFLLSLLLCIEPVGPAFLIMIPPVYSETDDPEHYLVMGTYAKMYGDDIYRLFPANIPRSAVAEDSKWYPPDKFPETTKYYYHFQEVVDPSFQIYAEWILPEKLYLEELNRIQNYYPEGAQQKAQWGDWTCLNFTNDPLDFEKAKDLIHYYYLIFACNEKTRTVRYIVSYSMDCGKEEPPYFLSLEWN